jgi:hypothetical protein
MPPKVRPALIEQQISNTRGRRNGSGRRAVALKLEYPELSEGQIAKAVGCDPANVHRALNRFLGAKNSEQDLRDFQEAKADVFDALQQRALMCVTDESLAKTPVRDLAVAAGIWEDKARTIRGQATQINVSVLLDAVQAVRDMRNR